MMPEANPDTGTDSTCAPSPTAASRERPRVGFDMERGPG